MGAEGHVLSSESEEDLPRPTSSLYEFGDWKRSGRRSGDVFETFGFIRPSRKFGDPPPRHELFAHLDRGRFAVRYRQEYYPLGNQLLDGNLWQTVPLPSTGSRAWMVFRRDPTFSTKLGHIAEPVVHWFVHDMAPVIEDSLETDALILRALVQFRLDPPLSGLSWTQPARFWEGGLRDIAELSRLTELQLHPQGPRSNKRYPQARILFQRRDGKIWRPIEDPRLRGRFTFATKSPSLR